MSIRPFDWRDLPALPPLPETKRVPEQRPALYRGGAAVPWGSALFPTQATGILTSVSTRNGDTDHVLIGQAIHSTGAQIAQLTFLCPDEAMDSAALPAL